MLARDDPYDATLPVTIATTQPSRIRILELIAAGESEFILSARSGALSIRALLHRTEELEFSYGVLSINWTRGWVSSPAGRVTLSRTELRLLGALLEAEGQVVAPDDLSNRAWPAMPFDRTAATLLSTYLHSLRHRLAVIGVAGALRRAGRTGYSLSP